MSSSKLFFLTTSRRPSFALCCAIALMLVVFSGCTSQLSSDLNSSVTADRETAEEIQELLTSAEGAESPERDQTYLEAASLLVAIGEDDWARNIFGSIDSDILFAEEFVEYTLLYSRIAIDDDAYFLAQRILTNPRVEQQWEQLDPATKRTVVSRRAELFALLGDSKESVTERIRLSALDLTEEEQDENKDALWQSLMSISEYELQRLSKESQDRSAQGWYSLAALTKNNESDLGRQQETVDNWIAQWPDHPASRRLPSDLRLLRQLVEEQPKIVGILLPLSGPYGATGKAIRDGIMAGYFDAKNKNGRTPAIKLYDTANGNINDIYDTAISQGAEAIIGPLLKQNIEELFYRLDLPVTTLALNSGDSEYGYPTNLYQFGLPVEDEAEQIAERAWLEGHRNAMVLIKQSDTGQRAGDTFTRVWEELGGKVVQRSSFGDKVDYQRVVKNSLLVSDSENRARQIRRLLGSGIKFEEARRRQDLDLIFMMARPQEAQLLKPTLNFHFASNIPVYATRHIYTGSDAGSMSEDLNGIRFTTLPWWFDDNNDIKDAIIKNANPNPSYQQFYAMGLDAYRVQPRLKQLELVQGARFYGSTGALRLNTKRQITRQQTWVEISEGKVALMPDLVLEVDIDSYSEIDPNSRPEL
ncbi:MAG: penicillin-binding protein activator [Cellvibrionaceae bacterium]